MPFREGMDFGVSPYVPAIAVPIADKDEFECPPAQVDRLAGLIEHVDRVLVIGWKGAETRFLSILASVPEGVPFDIVGQDGVHRVAHNLRASGVNADYRVFNGGFSGFARVAARIDGLPSHLDHFIEPLPVDDI